MSIPTFVFLDTSILDSQQYNFKSAALSTFVPICAQKSIKLLLPDPTEQEIKRHIRQRSNQAMEALDEARRKAPFLAKWKGLPPSPHRGSGEEFKVHHIAAMEWLAFLQQFSVIRLGYELVDIKMVMGWYDRVEPPFREGKKQKEFPDAFAIAMLAAYARREQAYIAVVSTDQDFKAACERRSSLLYFRSLPRLTEVLLSDDDRVDRLRKTIEQDVDLVAEAIMENLADFHYYHNNDFFRIGDVNYEEVDFADLSIVAIGDSECTVAFEASVKVKADLLWQERGEDDYPEDEKVTIREPAPISGTAKLTLNDTAAKVVGVSSIAFDSTEIEITKSPFDHVR
jgi:hypothetical protein